MKTNLPPETSWGQALDLMRQGKFPMDLAGMNPGGWLQMGTLLSKANLLQDETARLLGLTAGAVFAAFAAGITIETETTTTTQTVDGDDATINNVEGEQYNDNAIREAGD